MDLWSQIGSLIAVLALAGIAHILSLGGAQKIVDGAEAVEIANALTSGFDGQIGLVSTEGTQAVVVAAPGDLIHLTPKGARYHASRYTTAQMLTRGHDRVGGTSLSIQLTSDAILRLSVADSDQVEAFTKLLG